MVEETLIKFSVKQVPVSPLKLFDARQHNF
jgi:hypothetical protein